MTTTTALTLLVALLVGGLLGLLGGLWWARGRSSDRSAGMLEQRIAEHAVVRDSLDRLQAQMRDLGEHRIEWQAQLTQQVSDVRHSAELLRQETAGLSTALRRPQVRGRWGELHLRRAVEIAGLVERCDFEEQVTVGDGRSSAGQGAVQRPDLVVRLANDRQVVVDSKVPLDAFLDAAECPEDQVEERAAHLARHARQFKQHVDSLGAKAYWRSLDRTPEFVVMFVPGEAFLSAALESDPGLLEYAAARQVIPASPTTLIALLRTVALGWTQQAVNDKATEVHRLGRELHDRLSTWTGHIDKVGRSLGAAVTSYNQAVGSLESRVLVTSRRFAELGVTSDQVSPLQTVDLAPRTPSVSELAEDAAPVLPLGVACEDTA